MSGGREGELELERGTVAWCGDSISGASRGKCKIMRKGFVCIN